MALNLDSLTNALQNTRVSPSGISFAGKSLKLDTENDAKQVVDEVDKCTELQFLNLEGNTLGVDASKAIAKALEKHPEFKRALWKDMFTGRMKTEIPEALKYLGDGLVKAGARLTELDLSDNAFGPIGVKGLASLLKSSSCYALEELRLNNNGLGITGGKLLAEALTDCYNSSKKEGKPLALKVFIAGRNRLENEGAKALAAVFKMIGTLEEVAMPQNGIYHVGITALSEAFTHNKNLQIINLNDNTIGKKGAHALSEALVHLHNVKSLNFGDCLLKTKGAEFLAQGLQNGHENLEEVVLEFNEIRKTGALQLIDSLKNKSKLQRVALDGNQFGETGKTEIKEKLKEIGKIQALGSLSGDEDEESGEEAEDSGDESTSESEKNSEKDTESETEENEAAVSAEMTGNLSISEFLNCPSANNFMALGSNRTNLVLNELKGKGTIDLNNFMPTLMRIASYSSNSNTNVTEASSNCIEGLMKELFAWAQKTNNISIVNNSLLVNLSLIKSEDKKFKPAWNVEACLKSLEKIVNKNYIPQSTRDALKVFIQKDVSNSKSDLLTVKKQLLSSIS